VSGLPGSHRGVAVNHLLDEGFKEFVRMNRWRSADFIEGLAQFRGNREFNCFQVVFELT